MWSQLNTNERVKLHYSTVGARYLVPSLSSDFTEVTISVGKSKKSTLHIPWYQTHVAQLSAFPSDQHTEILRQRSACKGQLSLSMPWRNIGRVKVQLYSFLNFTLDGRNLSTSHATHFTPRESTLVPNEQEAGWVAELVWTFWSKRKLFPLPET